MIINFLKTFAHLLSERNLGRRTSQRFPPRSGEVLALFKLLGDTCQRVIGQRLPRSEPSY